MSLIRTTRSRGQGMVEYIIILALIAIAAIGLYSLFGRTVRNQAAGLANEVAGQSASGDISNAQYNAQSARSDANQVKDMGTYNIGNTDHK